MPSQKWKARSPQVGFSKGEGLLTWEQPGGRHLSLVPDHDNF